MTLQSSGAISLANVQTEFGGANPISLSEYYKGGATGYVSTSAVTPNGVPGSGSISLWHFYGATFAFVPDVTPDPYTAPIRASATFVPIDLSASYLHNCYWYSTFITISGVSPNYTIPITLTVNAIDYGPKAYLQNSAGATVTSQATPGAPTTWNATSDSSGQVTFRIYVYHATTNIAAQPSGSLIIGSNTTNWVI